MRCWKRQGFQPDLYETQADEAGTRHAVTAAVAQGCELVIACGGDGTVESVANALVGMPAALGILPVGTRNNIAVSLGIPTALAQAVALLRSGRRHPIDIGHARCGERERWFLETFTVGIFSTLYPDADAIQKGDFSRVDDLLLAFLRAPYATAHVSVDDGAEEFTSAVHAVLGVNMPATGARFRLADDIACDDGRLDLFVYDRFDKLDLLAYGLDVVTGMPEDPLLRQLRVQQVSLHTNPPLTVMADGVYLGEGAVEVRLAPGGLLVITP